MLLLAVLHTLHFDLFRARAWCWVLTASYHYSQSPYMGERQTLQRCVAELHHFHRQGASRALPIKDAVNLQQTYGDGGRAYGKEPLYFKYFILQCINCTL